jgi:hypothetical protein
VLRPVAGVSPVRRIGAQIRAGTGNQPHIAPVLESLHRISSAVAHGPLQCRADRTAPMIDPADIALVTPSGLG